jgi:predicted Zn-dependent protease
LDSEVLNAFAVPGGYVYFTRGIMAHFNDEAQMAGVLGHEIGHITARHTVEQQRNQILGQLGIIAGVVINPELARFADAASQGLGLLMLKFGRDAERESDQLGVEYSTKIGYDARQMAAFFTTLERQSQAAGAAELPDFLSTHPNPGDRNVTVNRLAQEWQAKQNLTNPMVRRNEYLRRIDGIIYGEDPKGGFKEGNMFYHPVMKFQFPIPQGWNYQNTPARVQMAPSDGSALMFLTLAPAASLNEAADKMLQANKLQQLERTQRTVNGFNALAMVADVIQDPNQPSTPIRTLTYFIQDGNTIYMMTGLSATQNFNNYVNYFRTTMEGFRRLTDQAKLNKKPTRVRIKTTTSATSLEQALKAHNMPSSRFNELAILNGMQLNQSLPAGTNFKILSE